MVTREAEWFAQFVALMSEIDVILEMYARLIVAEATLSDGEAASSAVCKWRDVSVRRDDLVAAAKAFGFDVAQWEQQVH